MGAICTPDSRYSGRSGLFNRLFLTPVESGHCHWAFAHRDIPEGYTVPIAHGQVIRHSELSRLQIFLKG
jgi:hypothetical protein